MYLICISEMKVISQEITTQGSCVQEETIYIDSNDLSYACYIVLNPIYRLTSAWIV